MRQPIDDTAPLRAGFFMCADSRSDAQPTEAQKRRLQAAIDGRYTQQTLREIDRILREDKPVVAGKKGAGTRNPPR